MLVQKEKMQLNTFRDEKEDNRCIEYFKSSRGKKSNKMGKYKLIKLNQDVENQNRAMTSGEI